VTEFLANSIIPFAEDWEDDRKIPRWAWEAFGTEGLLGLDHRREVGGGQRGIFHSIVFLEELGRSGFAGLRAAIAVHAYMATHYLASAGDRLQHDYLAPAIRGDKIAALAVTEAGAGSDLARIACRADPGSDGYVVSGEKTMVTNGTSADFYVVAVRTSAQHAAARRGVTGLSLLLIDAGAPGVSAVRQDKIGWHCSDTAAVRFDQVEVPSDHLIGRPESGFFQLMRGFQLERLVAAALAIGGIDRCLEETIGHLRSRPAYDATLSELQAPRHRLADFAAQLAAARQLVYHAAWRHSTEGLAVEECSMAKLVATELASTVASSCLHLQGSSGYLASSVVARIYRDAPAGTVAAGPSEVMRDIIAHLLIDEPR